MIRWLSLFFRRKSCTRTAIQQNGVCINSGSRDFTCRYACSSEKEFGAGEQSGADIGSAGESLAGGVIFTIPVLFLWAREGRTESPELLSIALIALFGGMLGVLFMIPLRNSLIVKEHGILPYPEGTACAEVLLAGENSRFLCKMRRKE